MEYKYKLIALDMDGTLLMTDKTVHPDTIRDIERASNEGIHVVYSSGRAIPELRPYLSLLKPMRYGICMSGAVVYDFWEGRSLFSKAIPQELVLKILEAAKEDDGMVHFLTDKESVAREDQVSHMADFHMGVYQPLFKDMAKTVADMEEEAGIHDFIPKVNIYFHSEGARQQAYDMLKGLPLTFAFAEGASLEMTAQGVTKAEGLRALVSHLGISIEETLAVGDANNDRAVLEAAGFSVAMGNAQREIKELCDAVTEDNDHNGVGQAILKYGMAAACSAAWVNDAP